MKTVFVSGCFNVLHPGHIRLFAFAKSLADRLIVAVESDSVAGISAHIGEAHRLEGIQMNTLVDESFIYSGDIKKILSEIKPDIVVKGREHELGYNPEYEILISYGGKLVFSSGELDFSSRDLLRRELNDKSPLRFMLPAEYMDRHNISIEGLCDLVDSFRNKKVLVIGELIIDEYIDCNPVGMSQEDPTVVVTPYETNRFIGGAGIVAAHAAKLGADVKFITIVGNDELSTYAKSYFEDLGVVTFLEVDETRPTILKQRYRANDKTLLRVSHLVHEPISLPLQNNLHNLVLGLLKDLDLVIFSDFNYGCLPQGLIDGIINVSKSYPKIIFAADSQSSSQMGDIARFHGMDLVTPTEREARVSLRNQEDGLVVLAEKLRIRCNAKNVFLKLGSDGLIVQSEPADKSLWITDRLIALNEAPLDPAGAGDSMLATSSLALTSSGSIWEAGLLGSIAAAIQVSRVGNMPISSGELKKVIAS